MKIPFIQATAWPALLLCTALNSSAQLKFDFEGGTLPPDTYLFGAAGLAGDDSGANDCLHLTEPVGFSSGHFLVPNVGNGKSVRQIKIRWRSLIGGGDNGGADGYSLNWATDLPGSPDYGAPGEEGAGSGLTLTVDTWDNGGGEAPGIELRWRSNVVAVAFMPKDDPGGGLPFLRRNQFVDAELTVDAKGLATFTYDTVTITAVLNGWKGITGGDILLGARTGGASDRHWIDDLEITTGQFTGGVFNGLFYEGDQVRHQRSGLVSLKLTSQGAFSGYLLLAGVRYPLAGSFDLNTLTTRLELPRPGSTTLRVELRLNTKDTITGAVTDGIWEAALEADRQVWDKKVSPARPSVGQYTVVIDGTDRGGPLGFGVGTVSVDAAGVLKFAGTLGDGSKVAQGVTVSRKGYWPLYVPAYGGKGSVLGWVRVDNTGRRNQRVTWTKEPGVPGALHPDGFEFRPRLTVAPYVPPAAGSRIIGISTGYSILAGGNLATRVMSDIALTLDNKIVDLSDNRLAVKFVLKTGLFTGTVLEPGTGTKIKFTGAVSQEDRAAFGHFIGATESGYVYIFGER